MANDAEDQWKEESTLSLTNKRVPTHLQHHVLLIHHQHIIKNISEGLGTGRRNDDEKYNVAFSKRDLVKSIAQAAGLATGPDDIHYQFLKHLPNVSIQLLLLLLNNLWQSQDFPDGWREPTVIRVPKLRKDQTNPNCKLSLQNHGAHD